MSLEPLKETLMDDKGINPLAIDALARRDPTRKEEGGHHV